MADLKDSWKELIVEIRCLLLFALRPSCVFRYIGIVFLLGGVLATLAVTGEAPIPVRVDGQVTPIEVGEAVDYRRSAAIYMMGVALTATVDLISLARTPAFMHFALTVGAAAFATAPFYAIAGAAIWIAGLLTSFLWMLSSGQQLRLQEEKK